MFTEVRQMQARLHIKCWVNNSKMFIVNLSYIHIIYKLGGTYSNQFYFKQYNNTVAALILLHH